MFTLVFWPGLVFLHCGVARWSLVMIARTVSQLFAISSSKVYDVSQLHHKTLLPFLQRESGGNGEKWRLGWAFIRDTLVFVCSPLLASRLPQYLSLSGPQHVIYPLSLFLHLFLPDSHFLSWVHCLRLGLGFRFRFRWQFMVSLGMVGIFGWGRVAV